MRKQDDYREVELLLSEIDFKFGAETLRLSSLARIFLAKVFGKSLRRKPRRFKNAMLEIIPNKRYSISLII